MSRGFPFFSFRDYLNTYVFLYYTLRLLICFPSLHVLSCLIFAPDFNAKYRSALLDFFLSSLSLTPSPRKPTRSITQGVIRELGHYPHISAKMAACNLRGQRQLGYLYVRAVRWKTFIKFFGRRNVK